MSSSTNLLRTKVAVQPGPRMKKLAKELSFAVANTDSKLIGQWGLLAGTHFAKALGRRGRNLLKLLEKVVIHSAAEGMAAFAAYREGELVEHSKYRANSAVQSVTSLMKQVGEFGSTVASAIATNPKEAAPQLLTLVITSILVSGGPDGDGGAPDLDLMLGIGDHRSIFSHSILMGAALEAGVLSLVELVRLVHERLPNGHDEAWDKIYLQAEELSRAALVGASLGLAYHLFVDGTVQEAPYKDFLIEMPMEGHQTVFVVNAAGEVVDAANKPGKSKFTFDRAVEERKHKQFRCGHLAIGAEVEEMLSKDELTILKRYGTWMKALSSGEIQALTQSQEQFVEAAQGRREPKTKFEKAWCMYSGLTELLKQQEERKSKSGRR